MVSRKHMLWVMIICVLSFFLMFKYVERLYTHDIINHSVHHNPSQGNTITRTSVQTYIPTNKSSRGVIYKTPLLWMQKGRLGNLFWQYGAVFCAAQQTNHTATILSTSTLLTICPKISAKRITESNFPDIHASTVGGEISPNSYNPNMIKNISKGEITCLRGYFQSWKYLAGCESEIKSELKFNVTIQNSVNSFMGGIAVMHSALSNVTVSQITFIGIHVRLRDRIGNAPPVSYISNAMEIFRQTIPFPAFIVASDDIEWCKTNINNPHKNIYFSKYADRYLYDFVLQATCNHSIITIGTFGWFAAWLTRGKVVYYDGYVKSPQKKLDHYPPEWISMM